MKIEELFLTIEQSKHLQELGLDMSDAAFCYIQLWQEGHSEDVKTVVFPQWMLNEDNDYQERVPTYTLQEVLNKLPLEINLQFEDKGTVSNKGSLSFEAGMIGYETPSGVLIESYYFEYDMNLFEMAYKLLCWVLENGYLEEGKK